MKASTQAVVAVFGALALSLSAGCASSNEAGRQTVTVDEPMTELPAAELVGVLHSSEDRDSAGPVYFIAEAEDGDEVGLVLPHGFTSSDDGNEILDGEGNVIAVVGEEYGFGGGEYALTDDVWSGGPQVDSLWLTGTIRERI